MNQDYVELGARLKREREGRALRLTDVARVTKIPARSLERLEQGKFEELPGDTFVRGFLRSYARCVGLDGEGLVQRYGEVAVIRSPVPSPLPPQPPPASEAPAWVVAARRASAVLAEAGRAVRRVPLTLAVVILVIVATLTLSLLLRRPLDAGDGDALPPAPRASTT
jgi:cytoskeletal protein RodZ